MFVIAQEWLTNFVMFEQLLGLAAVFAGDDVYLLAQDAQRAESDVLQISYGSGDQVQSA